MTSTSETSAGTEAGREATAKGFFDDVFARPHAETRYAYSEKPEGHYIYPKLKRFLDDHGLTDKKCLEIGTGYGQCQDLVDDYIGIDLSSSAARHMHQPFVNADTTALPLSSETFDCVWTNHVMEHVVDPDRMLEELWRVLKPGGYVFFTTTWQCGPWLASGYPVRPASDFGFKGKLIKASVPMRDSVAFRSLHVFPKRAASVVQGRLSPGPKRLRYTKLHPTYEVNWMPDATAETSVEPHAVYTWFTSRGATCLNYPTARQAFFIRTGHLTFRKPE